MGTLSKKVKEMLAALSLVHQHELYKVINLNDTCHTFTELKKLREMKLFEDKKKQEEGEDDMQKVLIADKVITVLY